MIDLRAVIEAWHENGTPGPWPTSDNGDGKRIVIGSGLVEGPNGYEVAEVYSDDCPREVAEANGNIIAAVPDLVARVKALEAGLLACLDAQTLGDLDRWRFHARALLESGQ